MHPANTQIRLRDTETKLAQWLTAARKGCLRDGSGNQALVLNIQDKYDWEGRLIEVVADVVWRMTR